MKLIIEAQPYPICVNHSGDVRQGTKVVRDDGIEAACYRINELLDILQAFSAKKWWQHNYDAVIQQLTNTFDK